MKDNKPWYEKIGVWVTIVAGICAIITFVNNVSSTNDSNSDIVKNFDNEINVGDQSTVIMGDGNTINYGSTDSKNIEKDQSDDFSVTADYDPNTSQTSLSGIDIMVNAKTSFPADNVTISAISNENKVEPMNMHGGTREWYFKANFYIKGTYTVTITAYDSEGNEASDSFEYVY